MICSTSTNTVNNKGFEEDAPIRILFCMPGYAQYPTGGFKVVYEYANRLAKHHEVTVVHPDLLLNGVPWREYPVRLGGWMLRQAKVSYGPGEWFSIDPRVRMLTVPTLHPRYIPNSDIVVATAWTTAEWVANYPESKGRKVYFVQDYEHLMTASDTVRKRMMATYHGPFTVIVISPVLQELLSINHVESTMIPNALDDKIYHLDNPIAGEDRDTIGFPYRLESYKGTPDVVAALSGLIEPYNLLGKVWTFGSAPHPNLPPWIDYHRHPSDCELSALYNHTKIFVVGSHFEGWGLPGMEAMACGAALVSTSNGGAAAYATHDVNALISPVRHPSFLEQHVSHLLNDDELRQRLANKGIETIAGYNWNQSVHSVDVLFEQLMEKQDA